MLNKLVITTLAAITAVTSIPAYADDNNYSSCAVEVAISTPPVSFNENVVFNITSDHGTNNSITLKGGSAPQTIHKLICSSIPYFITATLYSTPSNQLLHSAGIGQCTLKAGGIVLNEPDNNVSVVFPNDFNCN